ncbi:MAG: NTP transferase domain-containing protein [Devosia sp.]|uniref:molybdenum cofactor guanylyltransferase n=1 Tax=Devosia sp. TaxID=1871048 RepID=UPI001A4F28E1|nr:NTP transferase domain-containing protein [Devosia sp.]MBL8596906.1 NTP transferase domain-containing protein [Devosia sp.]
MTRIAAVILAGGRGERLGGVNKALLALGDRTLLDRAMAVTRGYKTLLAVGSARFEAPGDLEQVLDLDTGYAGPLAGVAAAVQHLADSAIDLLFSLAVDTPLFPADFVSRARDLLHASPAVLAAYGEQDYPTNAVWRLSALSSLPDAVRNGTAPRSLKRLALGLGAARLDYAPLTDSDPFRNANTPEDLAFLGRALERRDGG